MMEMNLMIQSMNSGSKTQAGGASQSATKAGGNGEFDAILTQSGAQQGTDNQEQTDPLLSMLAALAGGLSPVSLLQMQQIPLTNEELAHVLQQYGATPALMAVLLEQPHGQPVETLNAHPELLQDFVRVLSQAVEQTSAMPQLLTTNSKMADLMKTILSQLSINNESERVSTAETTQPVVSVKSQRMLGKLQATLTTAQALQMTDGAQQDTANELTQKVASAESIKTLTTSSGAVSAQAMQSTEPAASQAKVSSDQSYTSLVNAGVSNTPQAQAIHRSAQSGMVTVRAEKFDAEVQQLVIKQAQLIQAPGRQEFRIILDPHGLGEIEVRIQAEGNQLSVKFTADTALAKSMLDSGLASLRAQLQSSGLQFDRIDVSSGSQNSNNDLNSGSGMPHERGQGEGAQDGQGQNSSGQSQRSELETFSFDQVEAVEEVVEVEEAESEVETSPEVNSIDFTV